ncbi:hypothetical protein J0H33_09590 [bacterium]|nr:hypothetical protein [bacterium]
MLTPIQRHSGRLLALAAGVAAIATGCGAAAAPRFLAYHGPHNGDLARAAGQLVREGDCIYIEDHQSRFLLALPEDAAWDTGEDAIVFDGQRYPMGVFVAVGGSGIDYGQAQSILRAGWATPASSACDTSAVWLTGDMARDEAGD